MQHYTNTLAKLVFVCMPSKTLRTCTEHSAAAVSMTKGFLHIYAQQGMNANTLVLRGTHSNATFGQGIHIFLLICSVNNLKKIQIVTVSLTNYRLEMLDDKTRDYDLVANKRARKD